METKNEIKKNGSINFKKIPYALIYSRLAMTAYLVLTSICKPLQNPVVISIILIAAILTDIFDGVAARKFKCDSVHLRQLDSKVDTVFWLALMYVLLVIRTDFMHNHAVELFILLASEVLIQLIGYFKFNSSLALHTYGAKIWALLITFTVLQLLLGFNADALFYIMFVWGIIAQTEVILIIFKMKIFKVDVKWLFKA
jgi:phosphatidylglycerophosphate synthase